MREFRIRARSRRFVLVCATVGAVALAATAAIAYAAYPNNSVTTYTGCLTPGGTIVNVAANATTPMAACGKGASLVHLSGGTITQVSAGTGLSTAGSGGTGGSGFINNGFVTLGLLPGFSLPQDCTSGQVAKSSGSNSWACADDLNTTYSAGTGLDLSDSNAFSVDPAYQLPQTGCSSGQFVASDGSGGWSCQSQTTYSGKDFATSGQDCPTGQFANGIDANGALKCAQPTIDDLNGSPCTFDSHTSSLQVDTDSTTGAVSMTCKPVYQVSVSVSGGPMTMINLRDSTTGTNNVSGPATSASLLMPAGDGVSIDLISGSADTGGGFPFTYTCPAGSLEPGPHTSFPQPGGMSGTYYEGNLCVVTSLTSDYAVTASFAS